VAIASDKGIPKLIHVPMGNEFARVEAFNVAEEEVEEEKAGRDEMGLAADEDEHAKAPGFATETNGNEIVAIAESGKGDDEIFKLIHVPLVNEFTKVEALKVVAEDEEEVEKEETGGKESAGAAFLETDQQVKEIDVKGMSEEWKLDEIRKYAANNSSTETHTCSVVCNTPCSACPFSRYSSSSHTQASNASFYG
jgi:hypothetical protein